MNHDIRDRARLVEKLLPSGKVFTGDSFETDEPGTASGPSYEESSSNYDPQHSVVRSVNSGGTGFTSDSSGNSSADSHLGLNGAGDNKEPLVHFF